MVHKTRRLVLMVASGLLATVLATLAFASPASAYTFTNNFTVYSDSAICVKADSGIDHTRPGTFSGNLAYGNAYVRSAGCGAGLVNYYAAVRLDVERWNGSAWVVCRGTDWTYGYTGNNQWGPYGPSIVFDYGGAASCGAGYYDTMTHVFALENGVWQGGWLWSSPEYVS